MTLIALIGFEFSFKKLSSFFFCFLKNVFVRKYFSTAGQIFGDSNIPKNAFVDSNNL